MRTLKPFFLSVVLSSAAFPLPLFGQPIDLSLAPNEETYYSLLASVVEMAPYEFLERLYNETSHLLSVDANGRSMLSIAAQRCSDPRAVALLMRHRPSPDDPDERGFTPLMYAVLSERIENARLLLSSGANVDYRSADGFTALILAAGNNASPDLVRLLLDAGADLRLRTASGLSVHDAIQENPALKDSVLAEEIYWKSPPK